MIAKIYDTGLVTLCLNLTTKFAKIKMEIMYKNWK